MIAYWPAVIKDGDRITDQVGHIIDIMATFVDVSGAKYPSTYGGREIVPLEGKSLLPVLQGRERQGHEALYWQIANGRHRAIRKGRWKLISRSPRDPWELYDLQTDKTELKDLSGKYPDRVNELVKMWGTWAGRCSIPVKDE
jgi:arylsulfatase